MFTNMSDDTKVAISFMFVVVVMLMIFGVGLGMETYLKHLEKMEMIKTGQQLEEK